MKKTISFYVFNIKLQTKKTDVERRAEYVRIITELSKSKKFFQVGKNAAITMYSSHGQGRKENPDYIYGRASKGMYIPGEEVRILKDGKISTGKNDPMQLIDPVVVEYIFVPEIHRLAFEKKNGGPTFAEFEKYLTTYLPNIIDRNDLVEIVLERDASIIKEIYSAKTVHSLSYKISYTNDDLTPEYGELLDELLKDSNVGEFSVVAKADNVNEGLNIEKSLILKGGLDLAEKNGEVRNAVIVPAGQTKKIRVTNSDKPQVRSFEDEDKGDKWKRWKDKLIAIYGLL